MCINQYLHVQRLFVFYGCWSLDFHFDVYQNSVNEMRAFSGNFWSLPNFSSSCDDNYTYVKDVSFKMIIFGGQTLMKALLKIHAKPQNSDALAPSKKIACGADLQRLCGSARLLHLSWRAQCLPHFCQEGWWQCMLDCLKNLACNCPFLLQILLEFHVGTPHPARIGWPQCTRFLLQTATLLPAVWSSNESMRLLII